MDRKALAAQFRSLHVAGVPLVVYNVWDAGSALAVAAAGARALATGSWSVAAANGYADGEQIPLELSLANFARIVAATPLPASLDLETGYGATPEQVGATIERALGVGAVGCNIEDGLLDGKHLRDAGEQRTRIAAARAAATRAGGALFINARTDGFLIAPTERHDATLLEDALRRAALYAEAGADGIFVPGLVDERLIETLCRRAPLPVNVMGSPRTPPLARLAELGVARLSYGPGPFRTLMAQLTENAKRALG